MDTLIDEGVKLVFAVLGAVLMVYVPLILHKVLVRLGVHLSQEQEARLAALADSAVHEAEEWAAAKVKAKIPVGSEAKLARAVEGVIDKVPGITTEEAERLVRAALPKALLGAAEGLRTVRDAVQQSDPPQ